MIVLLGVVCTAESTIAATPLSEVRYVPDTTVVLGGVIATDDDVAADNLAGTVTPVNIGSIPLATEITAYDRLANGTQLLAFDTTTTLSGGVTVNPGDVVSFDGATYALLFDASAAGIPGGVITDAVTAIGPNDLLLSFDVTVDFGSFTADDEDLVRFHDGVFILFLDGGAAGVPAGLDLDAAHCIPSNGHLLLSFDGSGVIDGVSFNDEDVLELTPATTMWEMSYDGSAEHAEWAPADLIAVEATDALAGGAVVPPQFGGDRSSGGILVGSTRVFGTATVRAKPGDTCILIYEAGANGSPDSPPGSVDDVLLGTGGTDENGQFVDVSENPGIGLSRPLRFDDRIFAYDQCADLVSGVRGVPVPLPVASLAHLLALIGILVAVASMRIGIRDQSSRPHVRSL